MHCLPTVTVSPAPSWASISNIPPPRSLPWFFQLEIFASFCAIYLYSSSFFFCFFVFASVLSSSVLYWIMWFFFPCLFSLVCLYFRHKDFCCLWLSSSHRRASSFFFFFKWIYSIDLNSGNILQILLHVCVFQFHSFRDDSYSKKLMRFVV